MFDAEPTFTALPGFEVLVCVHGPCNLESPLRGQRQLKDSSMLLSREFQSQYIVHQWVLPGNKAGAACAVGRHEAATRRLWG